MADLMFVTEDGASHRPAYQNAMRDIDVIERVTLVDPTGATFGETEAVIGSKATIRESHCQVTLIFKQFGQSFCFLRNEPFGV